RSLHVIVVAVREENGLIDVAITVGPEWIVVPVVPWPQRDIEEVAEGEWPEPGTDPAEMKEVVAMPPSVMPAVVPEMLERRLVGEGATHAEIVRIGGMFERRDVRAQVFALIGQRMVRHIGMAEIGFVQIGFAQIALTQIRLAHICGARVPGRMRVSAIAR